MAFYESIAYYYDHIFPLNPAQVDFVLNSLEDVQNTRLIDVGCGTGNLCMALAPHVNEVIGIDSDQKMLEKAIAKLAYDQPNPGFQKGGMLNLNTYAEWKGVDAVTCFGNTLVHLASEDEIFDFLQQVKQILNPGGKMMLQIINYDRIFDQSIDHLPTIENDEIKFVRNYHFTDTENSLDFETILTIKKSEKAIRNTISLFPIRKKRLKKLILDTGFCDIICYGNFKKEAYSPESIPLIIEAVSKK